MDTEPAFAQGEPVETTRHLIHVGFPKAGSTFLQRWFAGHPDIRYAEGGLAGFHDVYDVLRHAASDAPAGLWRVTSAEGFMAPRPRSGFQPQDMLVGYEGEVAERQRRACHILAALFPNATILIVTRGFSSMILSSYSQYVRTGGTGGLQSLSGEMPWNYDALIGLYRSAFGADRVIILPYELLRDDQSRFLRVLEARLGLGPFDGPPGRPNPSLSDAEMFWYPRIGRFLQAMPIPRRLRDRIFRSYVRMIFHGRLSWVAQGLSRWSGQSSTVASRLEPAQLEGCRGRAECLRDVPEYGPYAEEYLHDAT
jgi:hypothetical protein